MFEWGLQVAGVADVLAKVEEALDALAGLDVPALPAATLVEGYEALVAAETRLQAEQARWLRATETIAAAADELGRTPRGWLVEDLHMSGAEAAKRLRVSRGVVRAPQLRAAWEAGELGIDHADVVLRALGQVPEADQEPVEAILVDLARGACPADVAAALDEVRTRLGIDESADEAYARRYVTRGVGLDTTFGGFGSLSGTVTPEVREVLDAALRSAGTKAGPRDDRTLRQRLHDGLGQIAQFYLSHTPAAADSGERPRVVVTMPLDMLLGRLEERWASLDSGARISPGTARRLACDAEVIPAVLGTAGQVLDLGSATRTFSTPIRRAAWVRDQGRCGRGGCRRRPVECHHMAWWSRGGSTSLDNAVWLCAFHCESGVGAQAVSAVRLSAGARD